MTGVGLALVLAVVFAATFFALSVVFGGRDRKRNLERLKGAMAAGATPTSAPDTDERKARFLPGTVVRLGDRLAAKFADPSKEEGVGRKMDSLLERAAWKLSAGEFVAASLLSGAGGWFLAILIVSSPVFAFFVGFLAAAGPTVCAVIVGSKRSAKLEEELPDVLQVIASSLRAGHSFLQALDSATTEVPEPSASEFGRVLSEIRLGREPKDALEAMAKRVRSDDLEWAVMAISIQREVGGNLAEVLDTLAETMRERMAVRRQVTVLSAEGRLSMIVLCALPLGLGAYMAVVNPKYLGLLFSTQLGLVMLITAACLMGLGMFWMRKVVKIDV